MLAVLTAVGSMTLYAVSNQRRKYTVLCRAALAVYRPLGIEALPG